MTRSTILGSETRAGCHVICVRFMGDDVLVRVIFGPEGVEPILGVVALASAGIVFDPTTKQLKRLHALPLKQGCESVSLSFARFHLDVPRPLRVCGRVAGKCG